MLTSHRNNSTLSWIAKRDSFARKAPKNQQQIADKSDSLGNGGRSLTTQGQNDKKSPQKERWTNVKFQKRRKIYKQIRFLCELVMDPYKGVRSGKEIAEV